MNNNLKSHDGWFERGSEWRLWDLHLHTPCSYDYKDKSVTNEEIISNLKKNNISAAVVTDHFQMDVEKITNLIELGKSENILILPGIELTSELGGRDSVHYIGIFDNNDVNYIWEDLKAKLKLRKKDIKTQGGFENYYVPIDKGCKCIHALGGIVSIHAGNKTNTIENIKGSKLKGKVKEDLLHHNIDILEIVG